MSITIFSPIHACLASCGLVAAPLLALISLAGCRLYEPQRYARFQFAPGAPQTRVLMIGDSLTYYNDLPGLLQQFSAGESAPIYIEQATTPLASLRFHWTLDKSVERIRNGRFDVVILQDFSRKPVTNPEGSLEYFSKFAAEIKKAGGRTIVFQNWTRRGRQDEYPALVKTYNLICRTNRRAPGPHRRRLETLRRGAPGHSPFA